MFNYCTCESHKKCTYELLIRQKKSKHSKDTATVTWKDF